MRGADLPGLRRPLRPQTLPVAVDGHLGRLAARPGRLHPPGGPTLALAGTIRSVSPSFGLKTRSLLPPQCGGLSDVDVGFFERIYSDAIGC